MKNKNKNEFNKLPGSIFAAMEITDAGAACDCDCDCDAGDIDNY